MNEAQLEVNESERVEIEPSDDGEIISPKDDEKATQPESSSGENQDDVEGKGEKLLGRQISSEDDIVESEDLKHLPDETPRERALRLEVTNLKRLNRQKRTQELLGVEKPKGISQAQYEDLNEEDKKLLAQYDQGELNTFEKIFEILGKKHGWVKKDDFKASTYNQQANDILDDFLQEHSEYLPENDKDDVLWRNFQEEFKFYKSPENPKDLKKIFNKIHKEIFGVKSEDELRKIEAQKEKVKVASHGGSSSQRGSSSASGNKLSSEQREHFKGFSDKDFEDLGL